MICLAERMLVQPYNTQCDFTRASLHINTQRHKDVPRCLEHQQVIKYRKAI